MLPDRFERGVGHRCAGVERRLERRQPGCRLDRRLALINEADPFGGPAKIQRHGCRRPPARAIEHLGDRARVAEVVRHERFDALSCGRARISELVRDLFLQFVAEHVVVAAPLQVQQRPQPQ